jgi:hypothetical protein
MCAVRCGVAAGKSIVPGDASHPLHSDPSMTNDSDGHARQLEDILEDLSAGRLTVAEAAEAVRRQSPQMLHRPVRRKKNVGVMITTVGILFLVMAAMVGAQSYEFMTSAVKTEATVTELLRGKRAPRPRYEYVVSDSKYTGVAEVGTDRPGLKVGDPIEIEYLPDMPAQSRVASWGERWTGTVSVAVLGGFVTVLGLVFLLFGARR